MFLVATCGSRYIVAISSALLYYSCMGCHSRPIDWADDSPGTYFMGLTSSYSPIELERFECKGEYWHRLIFNQGKTLVGVEVREEQILSFCKDHPEIVKEASAYQSAFALGLIEGGRDKSRSLQREAGETAPSVPHEYVAWKVEWQKGFQKGYYYGYARSRALAAVGVEDSTP
ncbi:MAG: hypothetical protein FLDDKLPJ_03308 [Phycisphaerae bacterium]|nr:hypothetical protein [Phycisphaerae bacterium]